MFLLAICTCPDINQLLMLIRVTTCSSQPQCGCCTAACPKFKFHCKAVLESQNAGYLERQRRF